MFELRINPRTAACHALKTDPCFVDYWTSAKSFWLCILIDKFLVSHSWNLSLCLALIQLVLLFVYLDLQSQEAAALYALCIYPYLDFLALYSNCLTDCQNFIKTLTKSYSPSSVSEFVHQVLGIKLFPCNCDLQTQAAFCKAKRLHHENMQWKVCWITKQVLLKLSRKSRFN